MSHKKTIARRLITKKEMISGVSLFSSAGWNKRRDRIRLRVQKQHDAAHARALTRKELTQEKTGGIFGLRKIFKHG